MAERENKQLYRSRGTQQHLVDLHISKCDTLVLFLYKQRCSESDVVEAWIFCMLLVTKVYNFLGG